MAARPIAEETRHVKAPIFRGSSDEITRVKQTIHTIQVSCFPLESHEVDSADEVVIRLNGRILKRMTKWQAERAGLIFDPSGH